MLKIAINYRIFYFLFDISENPVIVLFIKSDGTGHPGVGTSTRGSGTSARWNMKTETRMSPLDYGLTVTALSVPTLVLGFEFVNLIGLVYGGLIDKLAAVTTILGG